MGVRDQPLLFHVPSMTLYRSEASEHSESSHRRAYKHLLFGILLEGQVLAPVVVNSCDYQISSYGNFLEVNVWRTKSDDDEALKDQLSSVH